MDVFLNLKVLQH